MSEAEERVSVTTYIPEYQYEVWKEHAEELDMNLSEFASVMIQSGRTGFEIEEPTAEAENQPLDDVTPGGGGLESVLIDSLQCSGPLERDELVERLTREVTEILIAGQERGTFDHETGVGWSVVAGADYGE